MLPGEQTQECAHESSHMTSSYRRHNQTRDAGSKKTPLKQASGKYKPRNDETRRIAADIAKLPSVPRQILKDIPRPPNSASRDD